MPTKPMYSFDFSYLSLPKSFYSLTKPSEFPNLENVIFNKQVAKQLDLSNSYQDLISLITNKKYYQKAYAQAYAGHQFGHFTNLGDGRAIMLGELFTKDKERFDIQIKGGGRTIYSRGGDGKATLKAMLREYLISEAMHYLNIPTSRSLATLKSVQAVQRTTPQEGGLLVRVMHSHIRVGTFEYASHICSKDDLMALTDYTINRLFPEIKDDQNQPLSLLKEVMRKQMKLVANWMRVGFIHGVMNTDNTSISGEAFDYGPCAFMNIYNPKTVYSSIDRNGRYAFGNQPAVLKWNMSRFAEALLPIIHSNKEESLKLAQSVIDDFDALWEMVYYQTMLKKIGIDSNDKALYSLVDDLLEIMKSNKLDYTNTFISLSESIASNISMSTDTWLNEWHKRWKSIIDDTSSPQKAIQLMKVKNPLVIPRNHTVENVLEKAEQGNLNPFQKLLEMLSSPYEQQKGMEEYSKPPSQDFEAHYNTFCGT